MNKPNVFEIELRTTQVTLGDLPFTIKELTGSQRDQYLNENLQRMRIDPATGEARGFSNYKGLHTDLLSKCLYDSGGALVTKAMLEALPASSLTGLFKLANSLNSLDEDEEEAGNE